MKTKPHDYLTEPEWFANNAPDPDTMAENLAVFLVVAAIVAFAGWLMIGAPT